MHSPQGRKHKGESEAIEAGKTRRETKSTLCYFKITGRKLKITRSIFSGHPPECRKNRVPPKMSRTIFSGSPFRFVKKFYNDIRNSPYPSAIGMHAGMSVEKKKAPKIFTRI